MKQIRGFSLVELLVVITIVIILASFIYPAYSDYKASAVCTQDLNKLKALSQSMIQYSTDHEGYWVPELTRINRTPFSTKKSFESASEQFFGWPVELYPYFNEPTFHQSLSDIHIANITKTKSLEFSKNQLTRDAYCWSWYSSWGYNHHFFNTNRYKGIHNSKIQIPSETLLLANSTLYDTETEKETGSYSLSAPIQSIREESKHWRHRTDSTSYSKNHLEHSWKNINNEFDQNEIDALQINTHEAYGRLWPRQRKNRYCNVAFADGSVKSIRFEELTIDNKSPFGSILYYWLTDKELLNE